MRISKTSRRKRSRPVALPYFDWDRAFGIGGILGVLLLVSVLIIVRACQAAQ